MQCVNGCGGYRHEGECQMSFEPMTYCPDCGEPHDAYMAPGERLCECCQYMRGLAEAHAEAETDKPLEEISYAK